MTMLIKMKILLCTLFAWVVFCNDIIDGTCRHMYIRNTPSSLDQLVGCKVIEGSLQISFIYPNSTEQWENYSYPELREITGNLVVFSVEKLPSLTALFPNLAVIRGNELIHNYSLVISRTGLKEVGLLSLTDIQRGSVLIWDNPHLRYGTTIDWYLIIGQNGHPTIIENNSVEPCSNKCSPRCPPRNKGLSSNHLFWSGDSRVACQKDFKSYCPFCRGAPCGISGDCCHRQCLGGCNGTSASDCFVCKHVVYDGTCMEECPPGLYEYAGRRCVNRMECLETWSYSELNNNGSTMRLWGKIYQKNGKKLCVLECPENTELSLNKTCTPCKGHCLKTCIGRVVDSVESAEQLINCTRINGTLEISIPGKKSANSSTIIAALADNLNRIEEIEDYLVIENTVSIFYLGFLPNLKVIHGRNLESGKYAFVVKYNVDLMELWDLDREHVKITNGSVIFHHNFNLCPSKIWDFMNKSGISEQRDNSIGITNGDGRSCVVHVLRLEIEEKTKLSVSFRYESVRRNLTIQGFQYDVYYKKLIDYPYEKASKYDRRDPRFNWTIVSDQNLNYYTVQGIDSENNMEHQADDERQNRKAQEGKWEPSRHLLNLTENTWYALYVKAINTDFPHTDAESDIIYFQTLPGRPPPPRDLKVQAISHDEISISWTLPPVRGKLETYEIYLKKIPGWNILDAYRDYCSEAKIWTRNKIQSFGKSVTPDNRLNNTATLSEILTKVFIPIADNGSANQSKTRSTMSKRSLSSFEVFDTSTMKLIDTVPVKSYLRHYTDRLHRLEHFTNYKVGVAVCGQIETDEWTPATNTPPSCSKLALERVTTLAYPAADYLLIHKNVTEGNRLRISWTEPKKPNGNVLALLIQIQKVSSKSEGYQNKTCISGRNFHATRNLTIESLSNGSYTLQFQFVTSGMASNWTKDWFVVADKIDQVSTKWTFLLITLAFVVILSICGGIRFRHCRRKTAEADISQGTILERSRVNDSFESLMLLNSSF